MGCLVGHHDGGDAWFRAVGAHDVGGQGGERPLLAGAEGDTLARQDCGADSRKVAARLDGEAQVGAEIVEPRAAGGVAGGGDDGFGAQGGGHPAGQLVAAAGVRAEHRDRKAQRLVDADHGGVVVLGRQQRGEQPDGRADGEEADDGVALGERAGQGLGRGAVVAAGARIRVPGCGEPPGGGVARFRDADQADHRWPQRTKTGFCAARRWLPPGSGLRREAWSWTPSAR